MRAQANARGIGKARQLVKIVFEGIEVDDQCRRVDFLDRVADLCGDYVHSIFLPLGRC
jgi:hypothetical protein